MAKATNLIISEEGSPKRKNGQLGWVSTRDDIFNLYKKHLINAKECNSDSGCISQRYKYLNGHNANDWDNLPNYKTLILNDGVTVVFDDTVTPDCNYPDWGGSEMFCYEFLVDLNGSKNPML